MRKRNSEKKQVSEDDEKGLLKFFNAQQIMASQHYYSLTTCQTITV